MSTSKSDRIPYTYLVGWSHLNKWYYGRRTAKNCHPDEFWVKYFTSSDPVNRFRNMHGEPDIVEIRKTFSTVEQCKLWETRVLKRINAKHNDLFLNESNGDKNFDTTGLVGTSAAKHVLTGEKLGRIPLTDMRWKTGEIVGLSKNRKQTVEERIKRSESLRGRTSPRKGLNGKPHSIETKERLSQLNIGKSLSQQTRNKISNSLTGLIRTDEQRKKYKGPKSTISIEKGRTSWLALSSRQIVSDLKSLAKKHNVLLGKGWTRKSDEWIKMKIDKIRSQL